MDINEIIKHYHQKMVDEYNNYCKDSQRTSDYLYEIENLLTSLIRFKKEEEKQNVTTKS
jgi:hypothetical protein